MNVPHKITIGEKYDSAMKITEPAEAQAYFELCVEHCMSHDRTRQEAESIERENLGYYAGYFDDETRRRVEELFGCAHPMFGKIADENLLHHGPITSEAAFEMGKRWASYPDTRGNQ